MKIQYIAVIFIIIIVPIVIATTSYINSQITTIDLQNEYNSKLTNATYDAIKAFKINTVNNRYSSISDSKIRDIQASVNTFYNTLTSSGKLSQEALDMYVPALVFTMYDGYYIYSKYDNVIPKSDVTDVVDDVSSLNMKLFTDEQTLSTSDDYVTSGLKPYIYYSCRYKGNNSSDKRDFVVNYTLDNAITIYGNLPNLTGTGYSYQTLSGYLINPAYVQNVRGGSDPRNWSLEYNGVTIKPEVLTEHLLFSTDENNDTFYDSGDYTYLVYNGQKIYYDNSNGRYFYYQNYAKAYLNETSSSAADIAKFSYLRLRTYDGVLHSTSAYEYYRDAKTFSEKVAILTDGISQLNAVNSDGEQITFDENTGNAEIFVTDANNDPLLTKSTFDENRMQVIRESIKTNLASAIANYSKYSTNYYEYAFPELSEIDWEKITNNVSVISFLQGLPIGFKIYNNYCVITNNDNEEVVKKDNIYIVTQNVATKEREYHLPGCNHLMDYDVSSISKNYIIEGAYSNLSFLRQTVRISEGNYLYFYPQTRVDSTAISDKSTRTKGLTSCYYCIVNASNIYSTDDIIKGKIIGKDADWEDSTIIDVSGSRNTDLTLRAVRQYYLTALARERHDLYQANMGGFNN